MFVVTKVVILSIENCNDSTCYAILCYTMLSSSSLSSSWDVTFNQIYVNSFTQTASIGPCLRNVRVRMCKIPEFQMVNNVVVACPCSCSCSINWCCYLHDKKSMTKFPFPSHVYSNTLRYFFSLSFRHAYIVSIDITPNKSVYMPSPNQQHPQKYEHCEIEILHSFFLSSPVTFG